MKKLVLPVLCFFTLSAASGQSGNLHEYEPTTSHPFGRPNPEMPDAFLAFDPLIGECLCKSVTRIDKNTWADTVSMIWRFKYIMNGMAVQDETLKADGSYAGSIRQYAQDSARWYVHYYSTVTFAPVLPAWEGNKQEDGRIILYRDQKAPNGMDGKYKITFSEITKDGFNWLGEWVTPDESFSYPTWHIFCRKE